MEILNKIVSFVKKKNVEINSKWEHLSNYVSLSKRDFDEIWTKEYIMNNISYKKRIRFVRYSETIPAPMVEIQISIIKKTKQKLPKWYTDSFPSKPDSYVWSLVESPKQYNEQMTYMEAFKKYIL